jgi:chloride channel protein, CIC family
VPAFSHLCTFVGALVVLAARTLLPGDGGHAPIGGLSVEPTPLTHAPGVALAAIGTLAFGAVLGPEAPLIALGSAVGAAFVPLSNAGPRANVVLTTAGSFSAISALFGGPLVAGMLMVEAGARLGTALIPMLLPGLVAAAIGYLLFVGLGSWGGLDTTSLAVPGLPAYDGASLLDLAIGLAVGVIAAVLLALVLRFARGLDNMGGRGVPMPALLLGGALVVGLLAQLTALLGDDPNDVLFSGQAAVPTLVTETSASVVLVLLVAKTLGYAICLGCGFRGGPVFPAIFLGVGLATLAVLAFDVSPTLAVAVGTAAGMTAMTRLVFASLLFAALLAGSQGVDTIPAAVLAAAAVWVTTAALERRAAPTTPSSPPSARSDSPS